MYIEVLFYIVSVILIIYLYYALYTWTKSLDIQGCKCSDMWERKFINIGSIILPIFSLFLSVINLLKPFKNDNKNLNYVLIYMMVIGIIGMSYFTVVFSYIWKLKQMECKCSEDWKREFGFIYSIVALIVYILIFFSLTFLVISFRKIMFV